MLLDILAPRCCHIDMCTYVHVCVLNAIDNMGYVLHQTFMYVHGIYNTYVQSVGRSIANVYDPS